MAGLVVAGVPTGAMVPGAGRPPTSLAGLTGAVGATATVLPAAMAVVLPAAMTMVLFAAMAVVLPAAMAVVLPAVMAVVLPAVMAVVLPAAMATAPPAAMAVVLPVAMAVVLPAAMAVVLPAVMATVPPAVMAVLVPAVMAGVLPAPMAAVLPVVLAVVLAAVMAVVLPVAMAVVVPAVMAVVLPAVMAVVLPAATAAVLSAVMSAALPAAMAVVLPAVMAVVLLAAIATALPAVTAVVLPVVMAAALPAVMAVVLPAPTAAVLPLVLAVVLPAVMARVLPAVMAVVLSAVMPMVLPAVTAVVLLAAMAVVLPTAMAVVLPAVMAVFSPRAGAPRGVQKLGDDVLAACPTARLLTAMGEDVPVAGSEEAHPAADSLLALTPSRDEGAVAGPSAGLCRLGRGELGTAMAGLGLRMLRGPAVVSTERLRSAGDRTGCPLLPALLRVTARDRTLVVLVALAGADGMAVVAAVTTNVSPLAEVAGGMVLLGNMLVAGMVAGLLPAVLETGTWVLLVLARGAAPSAPLSEGVVSPWAVVLPPASDRDMAVVSHACVWPTASEETLAMGLSSVTRLRPIEAGSWVLSVASEDGLGVTRGLCGVEALLATTERGVVTLSRLASPAPAAGPVMVMLGVTEGVTTSGWVFLGTGGATATPASAVL